MTMTATTEATAITADLIAHITQFLGHEAQLLDTGQIARWVELLDENIIYEVPIRLATKAGSPDEFPVDAFRMRDDIAMIRKRIERGTTGEGWAEDPPSRTVRNVGSIFIEPSGEHGLFVVHSALTVYRQRAVDRAFDWIPARRRDLIRVDEAGCKLVRRKVILAETILLTPNLGIFL
jgi:3-phenylpropionate/cinnamic acid dioxygenase small subunit